MDKLKRLLEFGGIKKTIIFLIISGMALTISFIKVADLGFDLAWIAIVLCGIPIIIEAAIGLLTSFDIKADVLVSIALIASVVIGEYFAAGEVAFIMTLGSLLEEYTVGKARAGIESLVRLSPTTARVIGNDGIKLLAAEQVKVGDIIKVLPGEIIPVDGKILSGQTAVEQSVVTGESMPVDKQPGDEVYSGCINQFGSFEMKATKAGEDSSIQRMIKLVKEADASKTEIVGIADRWAGWIVLIAVLAAVITLIITKDINRMVTVLVVFCPCGLVLATPTAIMAAIGNASKHGFLVREADALERLSYISKVVFDKTGTLTIGKPSVYKVRSISEKYTDDELYRLIAIAELNSEHPLGKAIVNDYQNKTHSSIDSPNEFMMFPGKGVTARLGDDTIVAGNLRLLEENNIVYSQLCKEEKYYLDAGCTIVYVAVNGRAAGYIALGDTIKENASFVMERLDNMGFFPVLLTGDNKKAANSIASKLGIHKVKAECLPEDKLDYIKDSQEKGNKICMIGDGINDAPALKSAHVGIAMGGVGSDIAIEAADIAFINDNICELPHLLSLSKHMMRVIRINMTVSMLINFAAIILAVTGMINPLVGALIHNSGSFLVVLNSALLLKWNTGRDYSLKKLVGTIENSCDNVVTLTQWGEIVWPLKY